MAIRLDRFNRLTLLIGLAAAAILGWRFGYLLDDAFISLRYARHFYEGSGLRFNVGEAPVEGYTNFLWVLLESAGFLATSHPERFLVWANRLCGLALVAVVWWELRRRGSRLKPWVWLGTGLVALHETVHAWMGGGLEILLFTTLVAAGVGRFLREEYGSCSGDGSALWLGLAMLTRPEGYLFAGSCAAFRVMRRERPFLRWAAIAAAFALPHLVLRLLYYHAIVPNTFAAKVPAPYLASGIPYVRLFLDANYASTWLVLALLACGMAAPFAARRRSLGGQAAFLSAACAANLAYVALIGGDHFEFRLLAPVAALLALLLPVLLAGAPRWMRLPSAGLGLALVVHLAHVSVHLPFARELWLRRFATAAGQRDADYVARWRPIGEWLRRYARPGERIAVPAAGIIPYVSDLPTIDTHGLTDAYIAHLPLARRGMIAHERGAPWAYLVARDVVFVLDDLELRAPPRAAPLGGDDRGRLVVRLPDGRLLAFGTTRDPDELRRVLRKRGATVLACSREGPL